MRRLREAAIRVLLCGVVCASYACSSPPVTSPADDDLAALGEACGGELACAPLWLCVDGVCVERPWPPEPVEATQTSDAGLEPDSSGSVDVPLAPEDEDVLESADVPEVSAPPRLDVETGEVGTWDSGSATPDAEPDSQPDLDVQTLEIVSADTPDTIGPADTLPVDAATGDVGADLDVGLDATLPPDVPEGPPPANTVVFLVGADQWDQGVSTPSLIPEQGQGWVTQLEVPAAGSMIGFQAMMGAPFGSPTCGLFRAALWFPFGEGEFIEYPSWVSTELVLMQASDEPVVWILTDPPDVPEGPVRVGLIVDQPCPSGHARPALLTDTSGDVSGTWLYAAGATGVALVPGEAMALEGRWVLRALVEVEI